MSTGLGSLHRHEQNDMCRIMQQPVSQEASLSSTLDGYSQLSDMLPGLGKLKASFRKLLTAEAALARLHSRSMHGLQQEDVATFHARIMGAQMEVQRELRQIAGDIAALHSILPVPGARPARAKSCPADAHLDAL